jgi:hypothetical protein
LYVRTNAGLSFALFFFLLGSKTLLKILHYCPISISYCTIACTFARQPSTAALPGSLARQLCPAALPGSLSEKLQTYYPAVGRHAALHSSASLLQVFPAINKIFRI